MDLTGRCGCCAAPIDSGRINCIECHLPDMMLDIVLGSSLALFGYRLEPHARIVLKSLPWGEICDQYYYVVKDGIRRTRYRK